MLGCGDYAISPYDDEESEDCQVIVSPRPGLIAEGMEALRKAGHLEAERLWNENGTVRS